ncbi:MAG: HAD family hydrolase [Acidobacteriota bacterium]|nr:HAD family hydrolase [Acidobacteriota bacterium]
MKAVFFDVDFTLIFPGPRFQATGYQSFGARYGLEMDTRRYAAAVAAAAVELDVGDDASYQAERFVRYARRVIREMGGRGPAIDACAQEIYDEWAACRHFLLYDDVKPILTQLHASGLRLGLISNTHRCLDAFGRHFGLDHVISGAVSSSEHGFMKPHHSIFEAALNQLGVDAEQAVMVGDSLTHDVAGARQLGMRAVLLARSGDAEVDDANVPVIRSLTELPTCLGATK